MKMNSITVYGPALEGRLILNEISSHHHEVNTGQGFVRTALVAENGNPYVLVDTENLFGHKNRFYLSPNAAHGLHTLLAIMLEQIIQYSPPEQGRTQP